MRKHLLFYSQFCDHSAEALRALKASGMRETFTLVCVDHRMTQIPPFVDRVPMVLTSDRNVLADDDVFLFLRGSMHDPVAAEIMGSFSDSFSMILQDTASSPGADANVRGFTQLTGHLETDFPRIYCPDDDEKQQQQTSAGQTAAGGGQSLMDSIITSRDQDLSAWRERQKAVP